MSGNLKPWDDYTDEDADAEDREVEDETTSNKVLAAKAGKRLRIRVLPKLEGEKSPFVRAYRHFVQWPGMQQAIVINCPRQPTKGQRKCPLCTKAFELRATGNEADKKIGDDLLPRRQAYVRCVDRDNEDAGVQVCRLSATSYDDLRDIRNDPDDPVKFDNVKTGSDVWIAREGEGRYDTEYKTRLAPQPSPLSEDSELMAKWHEEANGINLRGYADLPTDEEIAKLMENATGGGSSSGGNSDQRSLPSGGGDGDSKGEKRRSAQDDFDPADDSENEDDGIPS